MKLYHGTNLKFLKGVDLDKCPPDRDFGQGFYLTNIHKHAEERAQAKFDLILETYLLSGIPA
ncbi:hypothetical protein AGMMS49965_19160 [Bacteroidia bacterium]|nr:hypothetical protein AGMMS49965_19160 [Bacteroidia bacterium]